MKSFYEIDMYQFKRDRKNSLLAELESKSDDYILNVDESELKNFFFQKYKLESIKIDAEPYEISKPTKIIKQVRDVFGEGNIECLEFTLRYNFEGSVELFRVKPQTWTMTTYDISIFQNTVSLLIVIRNPDTEEFNKAKANAWKDAFCNADNINRDIEIWNNEVKQLIEIEVPKYKQKIISENSFYATIGVAVDNDTKGIYTVPTVQRKVIPEPIIKKSKSYTLEPSLQQAIYEDILTITNDIGKNIEKKPSIYKGKEEEELRDYFLPVLESRYIATTVTGETFNKLGKTDISIKFENGENLFIAEFKIWSGEKAFLEAINQLFDRYVTYRDTKTALIIFVKNKDFTNVVILVKESIKTHKYFSKHLLDKDESVTRCEMFLPTDTERKIQLEVQLFYIPELIN